MTLTRAKLATINERLIQLRKEGHEKLGNKRWPNGPVITDAADLRTDVMYRTPMDDSGHLWLEGTIFFLCGRYVEYPWYYEEGWDLLLGTDLWCQEDTRQEKNNLCAYCKEFRKAAQEQAKWDAACEKAARRHGVTTVYPKGHRLEEKTPSAYTAWLPKKRLEQLYVG